MFEGVRQIRNPADMQLSKSEQDKVKVVLRRLFRENKDTYLKQTGEEISVMIRSDKFQQLLENPQMQVKEEHFQETEGKDVENLFSLSGNVAQGLEIKWFNRIN